MYAIIKSGGKQYRVEAGDKLRVEKLPQSIGDQITIKDVLMVGGDKTYIGEPLVKDASVAAIVTQQAKGPKVIIFKKKRRQGYRRFNGHRQSFTELFISKIVSPDGGFSESQIEVVPGNRLPKKPGQARTEAN